LRRWSHRSLPPRRDPLPPESRPDPGVLRVRRQQGAGRLPRVRVHHADEDRRDGRGRDRGRAPPRPASGAHRSLQCGQGARGPRRCPGGRPMTAILDRTTLLARRDAVHAELLAAMQAVERYKGALAMLEELLRLEDPPGTAEDAAA